ncbi:hypothetical protein V8F33_013005 [Rhypophila sp. PSN 637]
MSGQKQSLERYVLSKPNQPRERDYQRFVSYERKPGGKEWLDLTLDLKLPFTQGTIFPCVTVKGRGGYRYRLLVNPKDSDWGIKAWTDECVCCNDPLQQKANIMKRTGQQFLEYEPIRGHLIPVNHPQYSKGKEPQCHAKCRRNLEKIDSRELVPPGNTYTDSVCDEPEEMVYDHHMADSHPRSKHGNRHGHDRHGRGREYRHKTRNLPPGYNASDEADHYYEDVDTPFRSLDNRRDDRYEQRGRPPQARDLTSFKQQLDELSKTPGSTGPKTEDWLAKVLVESQYTEVEHSFEKYGRGQAGSSYVNKEIGAGKYPRVLGDDIPRSIAEVSQARRPAVYAESYKPEPFRAPPAQLPPQPYSQTGPRYDNGSGSGTFMLPLLRPQYGPQVSGLPAVGLCTDSSRTPNQSQQQFQTFVLGSDLNGAEACMHSKGNTYQ